MLPRVSPALKIVSVLLQQMGFLKHSGPRPASNAHLLLSICILQSISLLSALLSNELNHPLGNGGVRSKREAGSVTAMDREASGLTAHHLGSTGVPQVGS